MAKVVNRLDDGREVRGFDLSNTHVKAVGEDEIEIVGSTGHKDREGEAIDPSGWDLKNFKSNPIVLPAHDYRQPAIGKATQVRIKDGQLVFKIKFPPEGDNPLADVYRKLYKGGFMNASSVGFLPVEWEDGDGKGKKPYRTYTKAELLEISLVSVPCNPNALLTAKGVEKAVHDGVLTSKDVATIMQYAKDAVGGDKDANDVQEQGDTETVEDENTETVNIEVDAEEKEEVVVDADDDSDAGTTDEVVNDEDDIAKLYSELSCLKAEVEVLTQEIKDLKTQDCVSRTYLDVDVGEAEARPAFGNKDILNIAKGAFSA